MLPTRLDFEVDITSSDGVKLTIQIFFNFFVENTDKFCQDYSIILEDQVGTIIANYFKQYEIKYIMQMFNKIANEAIDRSLSRFTEIGIRIDSARVLQTTTNVDDIERLENKILEYHNRIIDRSLINSNYLFNAKTKIDEFFCTMRQNALERVYKTHAMNQNKVDEFNIQLNEARKMLETGCIVDSLIVPDLFYRPFAIHMFLSNETNCELVGNMEV